MQPGPWKQTSQNQTNTVCGISLVLLFRRFDGASSVVQGIPAACVRAQMPSDGGLTLTCEDNWPDSSWYPLTASDQSLGLIIQHLHLVNSRQWGATSESPWVFKVFTLTLYANLPETVSRCYRWAWYLLGNYHIAWKLAALSFIIQLCTWAKQLLAPARSAGGLADNTSMAERAHWGSPGHWGWHPSIFSSRLWSKGVTEYLSHN